MARDVGQLKFPACVLPGLGSNCAWTFSTELQADQSTETDSGSLPQVDVHVSAEHDKKKKR